MSERPARGAQRETEFPAFGNQELRRQWVTRAAALSRLEDAVAALIAWRAEHTSGALVGADARWIEARLEERVAVLRFDTLSFTEIRRRTLTGEDLDAVVERFERRARDAATVPELERVVAELRLRYKPPIMPVAAFLPLEVTLAELLMKRRSAGWFEPSLEELRKRREITVLKEGLTSQPVLDRLRPVEHT
jgi:methane monooxygenase component A gamma chain